MAVLNGLSDLKGDTVWVYTTRNIKMNFTESQYALLAISK